MAIAGRDHRRALGQQHPGNLKASYIALNRVPLAAGQSPSVSISIQGGSQGTPTVNVSALLTDPTSATIIQANGGSCQSSGVVIPPTG